MTFDMLRNPHKMHLCRLLDSTFCTRNKKIVVDLCMIEIMQCSTVKNFSAFQLASYLHLRLRFRLFFCVFSNKFSFCYCANWKNGVMHHMPTAIIVISLSALASGSLVLSYYTLYTITTNYFVSIHFSQIFKV